MAILDKIREAKEKVERKATAAKAEKRASSRRVERGEPETTTEKAKVAKQEATELGGALKEYGSTKAPDFDGEALGGLSDRAGQIGGGAESVIEDTESGDLDMFGSSTDTSGPIDPMGLEQDTGMDNSDSSNSLDPFGLDEEMGSSSGGLDMDLDDL